MKKKNKRWDWIGRDRLRLRHGTTARGGAAAEPEHDGWDIIDRHLEAQSPQATPRKQNTDPVSAETLLAYW